MNDSDRNDYFEMNALNPDETLNLNQDDYRQNQSGSEATSSRIEGEVRKKTEDYERMERRAGKKNALVVMFAMLAVLIAGGAVIAILLKGNNETDTLYDVKETPFVTESDSPGIDQIDENVIGTGMLYADCDIYESPDESSRVVGRLLGGTDVLVYAAEGDYYKVSDSEKRVIGYVRKENVNTGNIDLGNPDASDELIDETTGEVISLDVSSAPAASGEVNPEDFPVNASPYFIYVEKGSHTITIFGKDSNGKYTVPKKTFLTATGRTASLTPVGSFTIKGKEKWHNWGNCYSPYCCKYYGGLFFHGPLYKQSNFGTLMEGSVSQIGTNASSGCMRTSAQAAYFIYQFCWVGTNVKIVNGAPLNRSAGRPSVASQYVDPATNTVPVAGIAFSFDSKTMIVGDSLTVTVSFTPSFASEKDCSWSSSDTSVVSVSGNEDSCALRALKEGTAVITAKSVDGGYTASFTVNVRSDSLPVSSTESEDVSSAESDVSSDTVSSDDGGSTTVTSGQDTTGTSVTPTSAPDTSTEG